MAARAGGDALGPRPAALRNARGAGTCAPMSRMSALNVRGHTKGGYGGRGCSPVGLREPEAKEWGTIALRLPQASNRVAAVCLWTRAGLQHAWRAGPGRLCRPTQACAHGWQLAGAAHQTHKLRGTLSLSAGSLNSHANLPVVPSVSVRAYSVASSLMGGCRGK